MPSRLPSNQEKKTPRLPFNVTFPISYTISCDSLFETNFAKACGDKNKNVHHRLREIFFELLGCKDKEEFKKLSKIPRRIVRKYYEDIIEKNNKMANFTEIMVKKMKEDIKESEDENK